MTRSPTNSARHCVALARGEARLPRRADVLPRVRDDVFAALPDALLALWLKFLADGVTTANRTAPS